MNHPFLASLLVSFAALPLAGCFTQPPAPSVDRSSSPQARASSPVATTASGPGYYTVKRGDTLYRIALDNGQDYRDIAAWNSLANPDSIKEGQVLRVIQPGSHVAEVPSGVVTKPIVSGSIVEARALDKYPSPEKTPVAAPASVVASVATPGPASAMAEGVKREPRVNKEPYSAEAYARLGANGDTAHRPVEAARVEPRAETRVEAKSEPKPEPKPEAASAPAPAVVGEDVAWAWPSAGKVLTTYSENGSKGVDIGGRAGDPVFAAGDGRVVYAGNGLRGYGQLVIVKHNNSFLSAYAHNQKILVKEKQEVTRGQKIAEMGDTDSDKVKLHFEIRRLGKPIDPLTYLPKR